MTDPKPATTSDRAMRTVLVLHSIGANANQDQSIGLSLRIGRAIGKKPVISATAYVALASVIASLAKMSPDPEAFCWAVGELAAAQVPKQPEKAS